MADEETRERKSEAREDFEPSQDYSPQFSSPGQRQTGDQATPNINAVRQAEAREDKEQALEDARRINEEQKARAESLWEKDFSFGPVVRPAKDTLRAYKRELRQGARSSDETKDFQFSGRKYGLFDAVLIHESGLDANSNSLSPAFNPDHPHHERYAALLRNVALLRDYILTLQFPDGEFKGGKLGPDAKEDRRNLAKVQQMAEALGKKLAGARERPWLAHRWFNSAGRLLAGEDMATPTVSDFMKAASVPDQGIAVMYNYLLEQQSKATLMDGLMVQLTPCKWGLPPIEQTPFSKENMELYSRSSAMENLANALDTVTVNLRSVDTLSPQDKAESVEQARIILEKLRIKLESDRENEHLNAGDPRRNHASALLNAALAFQDSMAALVRIDPSVLSNPMLMQAMDAIEHANYHVKAQAATMLMEEGHPEAARAMRARAEETPDRFKTPMPLNEVMVRLESGLSVAGQMEKKHAAALSEQRASQQAADLRRQQARKTAKDVAAKGFNSSKKIPASAPGDNGMFRGRDGRIAAVNNGGIVPAAKALNDNSVADPSAPVLTSRGRT